MASLPAVGLPLMNGRTKRARPAPVRATAPGPITASAVRQPASQPVEGTDVRAIIRSKVQPPSIRALTLSRSRLLDKLQAARNSRLTLLVAEAGYGKTTLLGDFEALVDARCIWYRLDSTDRDWVTIVNYLTYAIREIIPAFGGGPNGVLEQVAAGGVSKDAVIGRLVAELDVLADTPTILILDDFHTVDESEDLADVLLRMIRDGPPSLRFILASRHRPDLQVGRLASTGDLAEITTDDLRFSREEIGQLFAEVYGQPLDADVLGEVDDRTQGWAASLQLFYSSIRGRSASDVRGAVQALTGTTRPLYDYLAQEVLGTLTAELRGFLLRASILQRITPALVAALADEDPLGWAPKDGSIDEAERLGLLHRSSQTSSAWHLHPLLRDFLQRQVGMQVEPEAIRAVHTRVAGILMVSEPLAACHHLIEAGRMGEAMQLLGDSVLFAVGTGQWGAAADLLSRLDGVPPVPSVVTIHARRLLDEGRAEAATQLMRDIDVNGSPPNVRAAFRQTLAKGAWRTGDRDLRERVLSELATDHDAPEFFHEVARLFTETTPSQGPLHLNERTERLERVAEMQFAAGHNYFAAISLHNAAVAATNAADYRGALRLADRALEAFALVGPTREVHSTHSVKAACHFELGEMMLAHQAIDTALGTGNEQSDVPAEIALLFAIAGERERIPDLVARAEALEQQGQGDPFTTAALRMVWAMTSMPASPEEAAGVLRSMTFDAALSAGTDLLATSMLSTALLLAGATEEAAALARDCRMCAKAVGAYRAELRAALVLGIAARDDTDLCNTVCQAQARSQLAVLEVADALGRNLDLLTDCHALRTSIATWPRRWLPVLRRQLSGEMSVARRSAELLNEHGELADVGLLRAFARTYKRRGRVTPSIGKELARRVSPSLHIDDLGRVRIGVGNRKVNLSKIRRKPAALLMYLVTRPSQTAIREQVLDDLWRDNDPASAMNSLNQSLYFIRRDIDPWYEDDASFEYVSFQGDILWLDREMVQIASCDFVNSTRQMTARKFSSTDAMAHLDMYRGQFSPEFEYEEWSIAWRTRVHASYLEFAQIAVDRAAARGDLAGAREIAIRGLAGDPAAAELEHRLIALHWQLGAQSAALAQYQHYAAQERADGVPVTKFEALTTALPFNPP